MNYLYNGVELPALPSWNKKTYPYAFIQHGDVPGIEIYSLIVSTASGVMGDNYTVSEHTYSAWVVAANEQSAANLNGAHPGISTKEWLQFENGKTATESAYVNIIWTNTNILNADGSVYLAASEPIPSTDHTAILLGWSIGKKLAAMRSKEQLPDIADVIFENGVLYIKNASAVLSGNILEVK